MSTVFVIVGIVLVVVAVAVLAYNGLVRARNRVDAAWSQITVQLKRRYDLIPNLVETVKGYAAHEKGTFEAVTAARAGALSAQTSGDPVKSAAADNILTSTLKTLFAVAEAYPELKANQNFLALQEELASTENRVAASRQFFNDSVLYYNTKIQKFPGNLMAAAMHFTTRTFFNVPDAEQVDVAPTVRF
ncbi:LemA family protein [Sporichthya polymorpha]|uniref:LemA family protein n=1 Tax=Sporichthya polymorpha TaxID=35751 RepID=UPI00039BBE35|nr:LemA family protein [Sporichthya polymorpha]